MTLNLPVDAIKTEDILNTRNLDSFESRQGFHFTKSHDLSGGKGGGGEGGGRKIPGNHTAHSLYPSSSSLRSLKISKEIFKRA